MSRHAPGIVVWSRDGSRIAVRKIDNTEQKGSTEMATIYLSPGAARAISRAVEILQPYGGEDQVEALLHKLRTIVESDTTGTDALASDLVKVEKAVRETGPHGLLEREQIGNASRDAQLKYLRGMSPAAADAYERGHAA